MGVKPSRVRIPVLPRMSANPEFFELFNDFMAVQGEPKWRNPEGAKSFVESMLHLIELDYVSDAHLADAERTILAGHFPG